MKYELDGREVENVECELSVGEGCVVMSAQWADTGEDLTDSECERLEYAYQSELYLDAYEWAASNAYDRAKDARWD